MSFDNAYEALVDSADDTRWAFGTGFEDALSGVDTTVPDEFDRGQLALYCRMLGDDALVHAQRLTEWVTRAPDLEEEVALANIALDLLGQARLLLARAGQAEGAGRDEDALAYFRDEHEFTNVQLAEEPLGDFARTVLTMLVLSSWRLAVFERLRHHRDPVLAAIAANGAKELAYHRDYSAQWVVRLGDGTDHSHGRVTAALREIWPLVDELFTPHDVERGEIGVDPAPLRPAFDDVLTRVFHAAHVRIPDVSPRSGAAGRHGVHSEHLGPLLTEMQGLARAHPEATW
jgi:ring-1,2-phenylacetyl-CoA epoxidase subunit PaaC